MTVRAKMYVVAAVLAVAATSGCGGQQSGSRQPSASATVPPDVVRVRGGFPNGDGTSDSFELFADGNRRYRLTILTGEQAGYYMVWDGKSALSYNPEDDPKYQRIENPSKDESPATTYFYRPDSEEFKQLCPAAQRLGTKTLFGRKAVRYHCDKVQSDQLPEMGPREMALDEKTGLVLDYGSPEEEVITDVTFAPAITADTFSTKLPPGASSAPETPEVKIGTFRLNAVGGGFIDSTSYRGGPLVIVAGPAAGIRTAFARLLPITQGKPPVVGFLMAMPPANWKGILTNQKDVDQLAASISKSVGKFAAPVGIDFKGDASYPFASGGEAGIPDFTQVTIALVTSSGTIVHATPATEVTDATLRTWIADLS